jgi:transglutaminase-like putative cysteine protease
MEKYLQASKVINWQHPEILELAKKLSRQHNELEEIAKACFEWVRDEVHHSMDYKNIDKNNIVTCIASDVLKYKAGLCFAKSHLLAALLRANGIPTGFCYQRLDVNGKGKRYFLHSYNAIYLEKYAEEIRSHNRKNDGWFRVDARGNRQGIVDARGNNQDINVQFTPPQEQLAYQANGVGEEELEGIFPEPLPIIIDTLQSYSNLDDLIFNFPDIKQHPSSSK